MPRPTKRKFITGLAIGGGLLCLAVYGCHSLAVAVYPEAEPSPTTAGVEFVQRESGLRVGPLAELGALRADAMWPPTPREDRFLRFRSGVREPDTVLRRTTIPDTDGPPERLIELFAGEEKPETTSLMQRIDGGPIEIISSDSAGIASTFDPAALLLPDELSAGETIVRDFEVSSKGNAFGSGSGKGSATVRGIGEQVIQTPAGVYNAFVFESVLAFKVGPARITLGQRAWVAPEADGPGLVAEEGWERVTVFGIGVHDATRVAVLKEESDG